MFSEPYLLFHESPHQTSSPLLLQTHRCASWSRRECTGWQGRNVPTCCVRCTPTLLPMSSTGCSTTVLPHKKYLLTASTPPSRILSAPSRTLPRTSWTSARSCVGPPTRPDDNATLASSTSSLPVYLHLYIYLKLFISVIRYLNGPGWL